MKILYITGDDPRKMNCGTQQRTHFLWKALRELGEVTVCCPKARPNELFLKLTKLIRWPFRSEREVREYLGIGNGRFDIVVTRYMENASSFAAWKLGPLYIDIDDMPIQAFDRVEGKRLPAFMRPLCRLLLMWAQNYVLRKCAGAWVVKEEDKSALPRGLKSAVLPNLARHPSKSYERAGKQEKMLMTVGLMGYEPNSEGVEWFVDNIWPAVHARYPELTYEIAGGGMPERLKAKFATVPNVKVLGFVDDPDVVYSRASAVVAPILSGAGTCIKVMEALLRGRKVLATDVACRGYDELPGLHRFSTVDDFLSAFSMPEDQDHIAQISATRNSEARFNEIVRTEIR